MSSIIGLVAHPSKEDSVETMERDVVALGMALMNHGHRLLLHASANLALPLMLAAVAHRAPVVLEGSARRQRPIVMMPGIQNDQAKKPDGALYRKVFVGSTASGESRKQADIAVSLFDQLIALGIVDDGLMERTNVSMEDIFEQEQLRATISMGWDEAMTDVVASAEKYHERSHAPLLVAGARRGRITQTDSWQDLRSFLQFTAPEISVPQPGKIDQGPEGMSGQFSEEYLDAWHFGRMRAEMVLMADELARRMVDGETPDRDRSTF